MSIEVPNLLNKAAAALCLTLNRLLPDLTENWWKDCVLVKLSFQQGQHVSRSGLTQLEQLDLAALLRLVDRNWYELSHANNWPHEGRNFVKEMQTVRNRWAHAQVIPPPMEDVYRDLDTLHRFLNFICPGNALTKEVLDQKSALITQEAPHPPTPPASPDLSERPPPTRFKPGDIVRLQADPGKSGAVTEVIPGDEEPRYKVFQDGQLASYYESQLSPEEPEEESMEVVDLDAFHAHLTALKILHPSISNLYSLHAARIEPIPYQFRPVLKFIQSDRPRLLIADSVGVGKTIEAGLILRELQARHDIRRVLIVCPRPLVTEEKWRREMRRFDERFEHLDGQKLRHCISETDLDGQWPVQYEKSIIPFSLLNDELLHGNRRNKGLLDLDPPPQFDLVIVDEAHHIRNTETQKHRAVRFLCENAEAIVFLTATPIQLHDRDLFVLLNLLRPDLFIDEAGFTAITEPNTDINEAAMLARTGEERWAEEAREALQRAANTEWGRTVLQENPRFQAVYDSLDSAPHDRAARVQAINEIERLHTLSGVMNRTLRRDIGDFTQRKPETVVVAFTPEQKALHDAVLAAQAAIYAKIHGDQSVNFLLTTIRRQAASCIQGLAPLLRDILSRRMNDLQWDELADEEGDLTDVPDAAAGISGLITEALALAEQLDPDPRNDPKYQALSRILGQKQSLPNNKAMLFSTFRHTLGYLYDALKNDGFRVGLIHGGIPDADRVDIRARFEANREAETTLDVLLFSEVGCEGLDYQFCDCMINFDIPWNPMRIDQRIGRIDRWGQESEAVAIYNLITPGTVDADIYERCLLRIGVFERALGANEDILGQITQQISDVARNLTLSESERIAKLEQVADNSIRLVKEQQDLEIRQTQLFGLQLPNDQYKQDVDNAASYWLSSQSLIRLASLYLRHRSQKSASPLVGDGPKKLIRLPRDIREKLLTDFNALGNRTSMVAHEWERWLKGNEPNLKVTFDPGYSNQDRTACLVTPIHPLVIQAANEHGASDKRAPMTGIQVSTNAVSPGDYPFAIYQWQFHGMRSDVEFVPVTTETQLTEAFFDLVQKGHGFAAGGASLTSGMRKEIESRQYNLWSDARAQHAENTALLADYRRNSLETSHKARLKQFEAQLATAQNERIRVMKTAQKNNALADYDRRSKAIEEATSKADITTKEVGWGIMRVTQRPTEGH